VIRGNHTHRVILETCGNSFTTFMSITPLRLVLERDWLLQAP
jgi:hypothetical protein